MTRINTILATDLTDQHLLAEYREITRIFALVAAACQKHSVPAILAKIPANYRMGAGHVLFFYDKLAFIERRYFALRDEVLQRQFKITLKDDIVAFRQVIDGRFYRDFEPSKQDMAVNVERLIEKIIAKPNWYKMRGSPICDDAYVAYLRQLCQ